MSHRKNWTEIKNKSAHKAACKLARGSYQLDLLNGLENLSGSTIRGTASNWSSKYAQSRSALLARMTAAEIKWSERKGDHGARLLVIG